MRLGTDANEARGGTVLAKILVVKVNLVNTHACGAETSSGPYVVVSERLGLWDLGLGYLKL